MVEGGLVPGSGVVALRALTGEVIGRFVAGVAGLAVGGAQRGMVEGGLIPGGGVVAQRALPGEVIGGFFAGMAGLAVGSLQRRHG